MFLRYYLNDQGKRVYTLKMKTDEGVYTKNAHPGNP
jgi:H/ACA ribonucleoprotein complex subunit 3